MPSVAVVIRYTANCSTVRSSYPCVVGKGNGPRGVKINQNGNNRILNVETPFRLTLQQSSHLANIIISGCTGNASKRPEVRTVHAD